MSEPGWIAVVGWDRFQHYKDRDVLWVKNYARLLDDPAYLELAAGARALLHGIWLQYARSRGEVPADTSWLTRALFLKVSKSQLDSLNDAGFIRIVASSSLASCYHAASAHALAERREENKPSAVREGAKDAREDETWEQREFEPGDPEEEQEQQTGLNDLKPQDQVDVIDRMRARIGRDLP